MLAIVNPTANTNIDNGKNKNSQFATIKRVVKLTQDNDY